MTRAEQPGWVRIGRYCSAKRRSIWARETFDNRLELCAGREGDDVVAVISSDNVVYDIMLAQLWALEMGEPDESE